MKTVNGDIWTYCIPNSENVICIPTNGFLTRNGTGVMGKGLALQAKQRYPDIGYNLGRLLQRFGNTVGWIYQRPVRILSVPVKPVSYLIKSESDMNNVIHSVRPLYEIGSEVPGYHCKADPSLIRNSLNQLLTFMIKCDLTSVYLPLLGCGAGGLDFRKDLMPILDEFDLPDTITLVIPTEI